MAEVDPQLMLSKFRGCLIGSHVGDCFGRPFEFLPVEKSKLSKLILDSISELCHEGNKDFLPYTDDTAMTLSLGRSLIENRGLNAGDMGKRFVEKYSKEPTRGYSNNAGQLLKEIGKQKPEDIFLPARSQFDGSGSYGNGAAMRIAPVALFTYACENKRIEIAKESSLITHANRHGYNGAILQCLAVSQVLKTDPNMPLDRIAFVKGLLAQMEAIEETGPNDRSEEEEKPFCTKLKKVKEFLESDDPVSNETVVQELGNSITAQKSVPTAIYAFLRGLRPLEEFECDSPFVRTLYFAISLHGDTDTIGAMACAIAGAYHGDEMIPNGLRNKCESIQASVQLAEHLYRLNFH